MAEAIPPPDAIEVLKSLNNAVHSRRIFPAGSPQIKGAQDRALSRLSLYLAANPFFVLTSRDGKPFLSGHPVSQEILASIPNLILYRQLELLQQPQLCLRAGFDEAELPSLMNLLAAKVEEIKKEGGGAEFIHAHNLEIFFPTADVAAELATAPPKNAGSQGVEEQSSSGHFLDKLPVKPGHFDYLIGKDNSARRAIQITGLLRQPEEGGRLLASCLATVVNELLKKRRLRQSHFFATVLNRAMALAPENEEGGLLRVAANLLMDLLPAKGLAVCFAQDHQLATGARLREELLRVAPSDKFGAVIALLREQSENLKRLRGDDDAEASRIAHVLDDLLESNRGKQYLGHEKAKALLESGELERKKKRVLAGLTALKHGDLTLLDSEEILAVLPWIVRKLVSEERQRDVTGLLRRVTSRIEQRERPVSPNLGHRLVEIVDDFRLEKQDALITQTIEPLLGCLVVLHDAPACISVARALNRLMHTCWKSGQMVIGDSILRAFALVRDGKITKPTQATQGIIQEADNGIAKEMLESFFEKCLENPSDTTMDQRLVMLGPVAGRFLIERLMRSEKAAERLRIIDLLSSGLPYLPSIVLERLTEPMPWYGKRNLLKLLAENGNASHVEPVFAFLRHDDLRVQREAFLCLYKISGRQRRDTLLRILSMASESIRLQAVKALLPYADETVLAATRQIIDEREAYSPAVRNELLITVCHILARCPPNASIAVLHDFLGLRGQKSGRSVSEAVWREAENAMKQLRQSLTGHKRRQAHAGQGETAPRRPSKTAQALLSAKLASANANGRGITSPPAASNAEEAEPAPLENVIHPPERADVTQAQRLRQLFREKQQSDNPPVTITAGGLMNAVNAASVDKSHLETWADFYDQLTTEEFTAFHQALTHRDYQNEEVIASQGEESDSLYMVNSGRVKIVHYNTGDSDVLLQTLASGEMLGSGDFLDVATWSGMAVSVGLSNLSRLHLDDLTAWDEGQPELEQKLREFCARFTSVDDAFRKSGQERRRSTRYAAQAHVGMLLLDGLGKELESGQNGELIDVSDQGLSLRMRITSRRKARQLLGRDATFSVAKDVAAAPVLVVGGRIVAVRELHGEGQGETENSLHVSLRTPIGERRLKEILRWQDTSKDS